MWQRRGEGAESCRHFAMCNATLLPPGYHPRLPRPPARNSRNCAQNVDSNSLWEESGEKFLVSILAQSTTESTSKYTARYNKINTSGKCSNNEEKRDGKRKEKRKGKEEEEEEEEEEKKKK